MLLDEVPKVGSVLHLVGRLVCVVKMDLFIKLFILLLIEHEGMLM